jgi:regulator of cell morphogenesis and NO signaling
MSQQTVAEIVAETPAAVTIFEKYRIDYCCGGNRPLTEVCQERGVAVDAVLAEVKQAASRPGGDRDWSRESLTALIAHILSTHHEYLKAELPALGARMAKVVAAHREKHGETVVPLQSALAGLSEELSSHMMKEEMILFPAIEAGRGGVEPPIRRMIFEHDSAGNALAGMRRITADYTPPADACNTFRALYAGLERLEADLHQHIHLENNILFPRALKG